jgi:hypothetical protein
MWKKVLSALIVLMLTFSLPVFIFTFSAKQTVMDAQFYKDTFTSTNAYSGLRDFFLGQMTKDFNGGDMIFAAAVKEALKLAITEQYIKTEIDRNIDGLTGYMNGNSDRLELYLSTAQIKSAIVGLSSNFPAKINDKFTSDFPEKIDLMQQNNTMLPQKLREFSGYVKSYMLLSIIVSLVCIFALFIINDFKPFLRSCGGSFFVAGLSFIPLLMVPGFIPQNVPNFAVGLIDATISYPRNLFIAFLALGMAMFIASFFIKSEN